MAQEPSSGTPRLPIEEIVREMSIPAGLAGPEPMISDVRCYAVAQPAGIVVIDTGMPDAAAAIADAVDALGGSFADVRDIVLTHLHMDHIQGLGFFKPLFNPSEEIHIWGPASKSVSLRTRLGRYFSPPLFPVYFRNLTCRLFLHEVEDTHFTIGPFSIQSCYVTHPGPTVGYRIQHNQKIFTYIPDHEPALGRNGLIRDTRWLSGSDLAKDADILLHDAQYTAKEYTDRMGWGHSAMEDTLEFASLTDAKSLLLTHHDPLRTDAELAQLYGALKEKYTYPFAYEVAVEGRQLLL